MGVSSIFSCLFISVGKGSEMDFLDAIRDFLSQTTGDLVFVRQNAALWGPIDKTKDLETKYSTIITISVGFFIP